MLGLRSSQPGPLRGDRSDGGQARALAEAYPSLVPAGYRQEKGSKSFRTRPGRFRYCTLESTQQPVENIRPALITVKGRKGSAAGENTSGTALTRQTDMVQRQLTIQILSLLRLRKIAPYAFHFSRVQNRKNGQSAMRMAAQRRYKKICSVTAPTQASLRRHRRFPYLLCYLQVLAEGSQEIYLSPGRSLR